MLENAVIMIDVIIVSTYHSLHLFPPHPYNGEQRSLVAYRRTKVVCLGRSPVGKGLR